VTLRVASYNIHKGVGIDRRRDPGRILSVLHEIDADVVALQEADRRFGSRSSCLPRQAIDDHGLYKPVPLDTRPDSIGWHGNALLVRKDIEIVAAAAVPLPTLEPRGAIRADLIVDGLPIRVVGMHLDISGIRRRQQVRAILSHIGDCRPHCPTVLMGDLNEWSPTGGSLREFTGWQVLAPGRSFHTRRPMAMLDRIILSPDVQAQQCGVHHSALAAQASDHLPVWADIQR
jgi:endonuclease/exonuclease/phosphatase family metal-dependent hydrolase